ncbi:HTH-type transcriptional regulator IscR [Clostridium acetireducens DSM 10703]|uniref:HTH-type transcriptional regulator IscR n=1 Tax=Clostridium acetireducens DSM 10703 TaxID=1121290 RepID=A0A1E8EXG4_9CLOT|nr:Rrf2 family transcriptional regulator [Clostridium acetireducens]OFI05474.1 HTH-type transcriptional regulator IscR [Clostridium acetireducens DSM 10703]
MNITQEADYGIRAILILTLSGENSKLDAKTISKRGSIPLRFLLKLLRKLVSAGIVISYRGINGGYSLAKPPKNINLKDVIEAIDGPIAINRCIYDPEFCNANRASYCSVHNSLAKVQKLLEEQLENINFENLRKQEIE